MNKPTIEEVKKASHEQLCKWWRFGPSEWFRKDDEVVELISERLWEEYDGFTSTISKKTAGIDRKQSESVYFHIMDKVDKIDDKTIKDIVVELMFNHDDDHILEVYNKHQKSKNKT